MGASVLEMFAQPDAPDPQEVVDIMAQLIATPPEERPLRTVVGQGGPEFTLRVNHAAEQAQADLMAMLGLTQQKEHEDLPLFLLVQVFALKLHNICQKKIIYFFIKVCTLYKLAFLYKKCSIRSIICIFIFID